LGPAAIFKTSLEYLELDGVTEQNTIVTAVEMRRLIDKAQETAACKKTVYITYMIFS